MNKPPTTAKTDSPAQVFYRDTSGITQKLQAAKSVKDYAKMLNDIAKEIDELVQLNEAHLRLMASKTQLAQPESHTARLLQRAWATSPEPQRKRPTVARLLSPAPLPVPSSQSFTDRLLRDMHVSSQAAPDGDRVLTSGVTLVIQDKEVAPLGTGSPRAKGADRPTFVKIPTKEELSRNYKVVVELHEKSHSLDQIASNLEVQFASGLGFDKTADKASVQKIHKEIQNLRTQVDRALGKAAMYLTEVATAHAPARFVKLSKWLSQLLEGGLEYKSVQTYLYVFPNDYESNDKGTAFTFCQYYWLKGITDKAGTQFKQLFVVLSCTPSPTAGMNFRLNTLTDMVPPSPRILGKEFKFEQSGDTRNLARTLGMQLEMDRIANNYGRIPINTLLKKDTLTKDRFSVEKSVHELKVDNKTITFTFVDAVGTQEKAQALADQLSIEITAWAKSTKARLRQNLSINQAGSWQVVFYYTRPEGFAVSVEDLEFLKDRLNLDDRTLDTIVDTINSN